MCLNGVDVKILKDYRFHQLLLKFTDFQRHAYSLTGDFKLSIGVNGDLK